MSWSFGQEEEVSRAADWLGAPFPLQPGLQRVGPRPEQQTPGLKRKGVGGGKVPREESGAFEVLGKIEPGHWAHRPWEQGQDNRGLRLRKAISQLREESSSRLLGAPRAAGLQTMIASSLGPHLAPGRRPDPPPL